MRLSDIMIICFCVVFIFYLVCRIFHVPACSSKYCLAKLYFAGNCTTTAMSVLQHVRVACKLCVQPACLFENLTFLPSFQIALLGIISTICFAEYIIILSYLILSSEFYSLHIVLIGLRFLSPLFTLSHLSSSNCKHIFLPFCSCFMEQFPIWSTSRCSSRLSFVDIKLTCLWGESKALLELFS